MTDHRLSSSLFRPAASTYLARLLPLLLCLSMAEGIQAQNDSIPAAPSQLRAAPLSPFRVRLSWQDNSCNEDHFALFVRAPNQTSFNEIPFRLPADLRDIILTGLAADSDYAFQVLARNNAGESVRSAPVSAQTFPLAAPCTTSPRRLCLLGGRFVAEVDFRDQYVDGRMRRARAVPQSDDTGHFWFFSPNNLELLVEMVPPATPEDSFTLRYSALTNLEYTLRVTDTASGAERHYENPSGTLCGGEDTDAFVDQPAIVTTEPMIAQAPSSAGLATSPGVDLRSLFTAGALVASTCERGPLELRLLDERFSVFLDWTDENGEIQHANALMETANSGFFTIDDSGRADLSIKILDGRSINEHFWLFFAPIAGIESWLTVSDQSTGATRIYYNPPGEICGQATTVAFRD